MLREAVFEKLAGAKRVARLLKAYTKTMPSALQKTKTSLADTGLDPLMRQATLRHAESVFKKKPELLEGLVRASEKTNRRMEAYKGGVKAYMRRAKVSGDPQWRGEVAGSVRRAEALGRGSGK